jgi:hypothetical protein
MTRFLSFAALLSLAVVAIVLAWPSLAHAQHVIAALHFHQGDVPTFTCGPALEVISGFVTAPGAVLTNWTMAQGDSLQVRYSDPSKMVRLLSAWFKNQVAGAFQITSPRMHDNVTGYHAQIQAAATRTRWPVGYAQRLYQNDILSVKQSGSGVGGQIETGSFLVYYDDLPGANGRFIDNTTLGKRMVNLVTTKNSIVTVATGTYGGAQAINTTDDQFKANTDYALIGYLVDTICGTVGWRSADTGNLRVGGPGNNIDNDITHSWFIMLSEWFGVPLIPVFNSAAKQSILVDATQDQAAAGVVVNSIFAELAPAA